MQGIFFFEFVEMVESNFSTAMADAVAKMLMLTIRSKSVNPRIRFGIFRIVMATDIHVDMSPN